MASKTKPPHRHSEDQFTVIVRFLEMDSQEDIGVPEDATGKWLFDEVCRKQNILEEKDYFGLRYLESEMLSPPTKQWLSLSRGALVQLKHTHPRLVSFRFKHYPADPLADLKLPKTHYLLYQQLRRDLLSGRLAASDEVIIRLAALVLQVELGDSSMQDHPALSASSTPERCYISGFKVLHNQTTKIEAQLLEEHKKLEGLLPSEAAMELIELASRLETYGIDPVRVKTKAFGSRPIHLGLTHRGVAEFVSNRSQCLFPWSDISWMTCDGRYFILAITKTSSKKKKTTETVRFKCESKAVARAMWEWASDRQLFMTLERSSSAQVIKSKRGIFSRSHTFKFSGRCRREILGRHNLAATLPPGLGSGTQNQSESFGSPELPSTSSIPTQTNGLSSMTSPPIASRSNITPSKSYTSPAVTEPLSVELDHSNSAFTVDSRVSTMNTTLSEPPLAQSRSQTFGSPGPSPQTPRLRELMTSSPRLVQTDQLVPYFATMPRRRYTPDAQDRQNKLVESWHSPKPGQVTDSDWSAEEVIADLQATAEAGRIWAAQASPMTQVTKNKITAQTTQSSPVRRTNEPICQSTPRPNEEQTEGEQSSSGWRTLAVSIGLLTGASLFSLAVILETDWHLPVAAAVREHPWILDFDARIYRPLRSALFGFWRRT